MQLTTNKKQAKSMLPGCGNGRISLCLWLVVALGAVALRSSFLSTQRGAVKLDQRNEIRMPGIRFMRNKTASDVDRLVAKNDDTAAKTALPPCRRHQVQSGQWMAANLDEPPYVTTVKHLRCYASDVYSQSPYRTWKWVPKAALAGQCTFADYDPAEFCQLMPRATIAIIGDSLSWEHYRSLVQVHGAATRQGYQHQSRELETNIQQPICDGGATAVVYRRDDTLRHLTAALRQNFPVVLVLNRGAHYVPDRELVRDIRKLAKEVRAWLAQCDNMGIECYFFWRTSVPGHVGCENATGPVFNLAAMEALVEDVSRYDNATIEYHWHDFRRQNELIVQEFVKADLSSFIVLDAYHLNMLRPDEHRAHAGDCLHSCFPGKMDVYNQLLLHYLRMRRSANDVRGLQAVAAELQWPIDVTTDYDEAATAAARAIREAAELAELELLQGADQS